MDISKMSVQELKALAYDMMGQIQSLQNQVGALNQLIAEKSKEEKSVSIPAPAEVVESGI